MDVDRRRFVGIAVGLLASTTGCASVALTRIAPTGGALRLPVRNYPQLARPGGYLRVLPEGSATPLYVLALEDQQFAALSPICTHLGCTVAIEGPQLVCPCHGSTYDRTGRVLRGPAERPLRRLPASVTPDGDLVIQLEGQG